MSFTEKFTNYKIENFGYVRLPEIKNNQGISNLEYINQLTESGFKTKLVEKRIPESQAEIYKKRYLEELAVFNKNGLVDYFLLLYDFISFCDKMGYARGIARGSASGSLVLYLLGITNIDPLKHNLYFTRFINEARLQSKMINGILHVQGSSAPDCDLDVSFKNRDKAVEYLENLYKGKTSKISTASTFSGKLLIKEVVKSVLGYNEFQAKELSDLIERHFGVVEKLSEVYERSPEFKKWADEHKECYDIAQKLELLIKNKGKHPSGIAVSYYDIDGYTPLELSSKKEIVTSYDMYEIANCLLKVDVLGLKNADINYDVCKLINKNVNDIDINDQSIYTYLSSTDNYYGLFQIESGLTKQVVIKVKPKNIDQLAACVAISRPGAFAHIDKYLDYIHNDKLESIYPPIDNILKDTANIILYQEQISQICQQIYKMSDIDADQVRYAVGKKRKDLMAKWEPVLYEKGKINNIPENVTKYFWDTCNSSADYLFVKGHAYSYAYMTAINTYLKMNYRKEFYLALLSMAKYEPDSLQIIETIKAEMDFFGINLLPPNLLKSNLEFSVEENGIRFGLNTIKGVAEKSFEKLIQFRKPYSNKFEMFQAAEQAELNIGIVSSLIMAGCLEPMFTESRIKMVLEAQLWNILTDREKALAIQYVKDYKFDLIETIKFLKTKLNEKNKPVIKESRLETIRKKFSKPHEIYKNNIQYKELAYYFYETLHIGFSYTTNLKKIYSQAEPEIINIQEIKLLDENEYVQFVAIVEKSYLKKSKAGNKYLQLIVKDENGQLDVKIFKDKMEHCKYENNGEFPKEQEIVFIKGKKMQGNVIFADSIVIQRHKIFTKISEIKLEKD